MTSPRRSVGLVTSLALGALALAACSATPPTGPGATDPTSKPDQLVLGDAQELGGYNPVRGYGELGVSPLYDGLMRLESTAPDRLPGIVPALADEPPAASDDQRTWTVTLRPGVTFHDGSAFDAADVEATYRAILDPETASDIQSSLDMVESVQATSDDTVTFRLNYPYVDFPSRLLIGIAPSELLAPGKAEDSTLNTRPVGTGPYRLAELTPDRAVFTANETYWDGPPAVRRLTTVSIPDDNARAQRMLAGEIDGTSLPPQLARTFADRQGMETYAATSADWRGIALPSSSPFAQDPAARMAMNLAVDRDTMVESIMAGQGRPAHSPVADVYAEAYDPAARFPHDPARAAQLLDEAGWTPGSDGVRRKGADIARFTVAYNPTDTLRRDLATAFAADMRTIGVAVDLEGLTFTAIRPRQAELGVLLGGGDKPYSLDTQVYGALHTPVPGGAWWDNPGGFGSPAMDAALDTARRTTDATDRTRLYQQLQQQYLEDPSYVFLAFLDHTYVAKNNAWDTGSLVAEPHSHGVGWGPWWNLHRWQ